MNGAFSKPLLYGLFIVEITAYKKACTTQIDVDVHGLRQDQG